jgi:hypothetical protein
LDPGPAPRGAGVVCEACAIMSAMSELIFVVEEAPEGGYTARALGQPIFTEADTLEELEQMVRDAVRCHFDEGQAPKVIRLHHVKDQVLPA